ncbi:TetR/AcrR family transcriptional regulator, partial [Rhodococcus opacus]|nr:TetR/AcrR family transcriptional regulator [Rhodococcus opacus]
PAAERQIELILGVLDAWMAAHLGDAPAPAAPAPKTASPEEAMRSLVSWVSVE